MRIRPIHLFIVSILFGCTLALGKAGAQQLTTVRVASGLSQPLFVTAPIGDYERIFILEQVAARIKILKDGVILPQPFLNLDPRVGNGGGEQGLLGMAFHPDYAQNGYFFVDYTDNAGNTVVARYQVTSNPDSADYDSEYIILSLDQPYVNHNGGMLAFGPDGYLYIGTGDGGSAFDPGNRAQNGQSLFGKMLRIDVDGGSPYAVPSDNPFVGVTGMLGEIWAIGLRNPWRYGFDRLTGDLYIADVGQNQWEEIDFQPAGQGGQNYGWRVFEGNHSTGLSGYSTVVQDTTFPIYEYSHSGGNCSVTGGYVYRGGAIPFLQGTYFFADFCSNQIWSFRYDGNNLTEFQNRTSELAPGGGLSITSISSFGEDASGELYITDLNGGEVFKIVSTIEINLIPYQTPIIIPAGGGSFGYTVDITNHGTTAANFDAWIDVLLPDSSLFGPLILRIDLQIPAGGIITRPNMVQNVPASAPAGNYTYQGHLGQYPVETWSLDFFTFEKQGTTASGTGGISHPSDQENDWLLSGWEGKELSRSQSTAPIETGQLVVSPNPFNPVTTLSFTLPQASLVRLRIYDVSGKNVATLIYGWEDAGAHAVTFDGSNLASGLYLAQIHTNRSSQIKKMTLVK